MKKLRLDFLIPEGSEPKSTTNTEIDDRITQELDIIKQNANNTIKDISINRVPAPAGTGGFSFLIERAIEFYGDNQELVHTFISIIANRINIVISDHLKKRKATKKAHTIILEFQGERIELPATDKEVEKFVEQIKTKAK